MPLSAAGQCLNLSMQHGALSQISLPEVYRSNGATRTLTAIISTSYNCLIAPATFIPGYVTKTLSSFGSVALSVLPSSVITQNLNQHILASAC